METNTKITFRLWSLVSQELTLEHKTVNNIVILYETHFKDTSEDSSLTTSVSWTLASFHSMCHLLTCSSVTHMSDCFNIWLNCIFKYLHFHQTARVKPLPLSWPPIALGTRKLSSPLLLPPHDPPLHPPSLLHECPIPLFLWQPPHLFPQHLPAVRGRHIETWHWQMRWKRERNRRHKSWRESAF